MSGIAALSALPVLATGIDRARSAQADAAQRIAAQGPDVDAIVELSVAGLAMEAAAVAFRSVAETERTLIDLLA